MADSGGAGSGSGRPAVEARGLTKRYGDFLAVDGIDFRVEPGTCFGFLGPNGAGKTSTMKMIYGRSPVTAGSLTVLGMDARTSMRAIKGLIGVVPQEDNLDPDFSARENLVVYAGYFDIGRREARRRADELLGFAGLEDKADVPVDRLSGGMKRRLVIVRALVNEPRLVVLDEPTTGLDPQARHAVWDRLVELRGQGVTLLLTTHYMDEAAELCDRLVIMDGGRILAEGTPARMVEQYAGAAVVELDGAEPLPAGGEGAPSWPEPLRRESAGGRTRLYVRTLGDAERLLAAAGPRVRRFRPATLEDVFLHLTGREMGGGAEGS